MLDLCERGGSLFPQMVRDLERQNRLDQAQIASIKGRTLGLVCIICRDACTAVAPVADRAGILRSPKGAA